MDEFDKQAEAVIDRGMEDWNFNLEARVAAALRELAERNAMNVANKDMELNELREQMRDEGNKLRAEIGRLRQVANGDHSVISKLTRKVDAMKETIDALHERIAGLRSSNRNKSSQIARLRNDLSDALDIKAGHGPTVLTDLANEIAALKAQLSDYEHLAAAYGLQAKELEKVKQDAEYWQQEAGREDKAMTTERLAALMAHLNIIDWNALNDSDNYDGGYLMARIAELNTELQRCGLRKDGEGPRGDF